MTGGSGDRRPVSRRSILLGAAGVGLGGAAVAGVAIGRSGGSRPHRVLDPPVNPGPATERAAGTLAGPRAKPLWSSFVRTSAYSVAATGRTVFAVDFHGSAHVLDPRTGSAAGKPPTLFFIGGDVPVTVVGDTAYGSDEDRGFLAVDTATGAVRWKIPYPDPNVVVTSVAGSAGPLVFSTSEIFDQSGGTGRGSVWCMDTAARKVAWTIDEVNADLAVVASEAAGVVVTADRTALRLIAYALKDRSVLWRKDAGYADRTGIPASPTACVVASGGTVYWASDRLYALDAATGDVRWTGAAGDPKAAFQSVIVLPGQAPGGADLVVASATAPSGGTLHAFADGTGATVWSVRGGPQFGLHTVLAAGTGGSAAVVYAAEQDNGSVFAVDARTGQTRWTYHDSDITSDRRWTITADEQRVYVAYAESVYAFKP